MRQSSSAVDLPNLLNPTSTAGNISQASSNQSPLHRPDQQAQIRRPSSPNMAAAVSLPPMLSHEERPALPRPYNCHLCNRAFHRLEHRARHIRTHTGERPHHCTFPGCPKRFSRSDELTRHMRIHNNPNSRRNHRTTSGVSGLSEAPRGTTMAQTQMMPPPGRAISRSAPTSSTGSPSVSPPHSFSTFGPHVPTMLGAYGRNEDRVNMPDSNLPATADSQVERGEDYPIRGTSRQPFPHQHQFSGQRPTFQNSAPLPSLSAYALFHSMSRSHSDHEDQSHRIKRSRPSSPNFTAPASPTFSHDSLSPTPDHTPIITPAHSPRLRPYGNPDLQLPGIRHLSLGHTPALAPMEPCTDRPAPLVQHSQHSGTTISDIMSRRDGSQRRLPVPQVPKLTVQDILNPGSGVGLGSSISGVSVYGDAVMERH